MQQTENQKQGLLKIYEKIKGLRKCMITTADKNKGTLHSRPMTTIEAEKDGTLWFFTYSNSEKASEVVNYSQVNVSYSDEGSDLYVSVSGSAEINKDKAKMKELWNPVLKAFFPDELETPGICLLKVNISEADYWDSKASKMVQLFRMAKAVITGEVVDLGEHEKINLRK